MRKYFSVIIFFIFTFISNGQFLDKIPDNNISSQFEYKKFSNPISLSKDTLINNAQFLRAQFLSQSDFSGVKFDSIINFSETNFVGKSDFRDSQFYSRANYSGAIFSSLAYFYWINFYAEADFEDVKFHSIADFRNTKFAKEAYFFNTKFDSTAIFKETEFSSDAYFSKSKFYSNVDFSGTIFHKQADFENSNFNSLVDFNNVNFLSSVDFSHIKFNENGFLDLSGVEFKENQICPIYLNGTDLSKVKLRYGNFRLAFYTTDDSNTRETSYLNLKKRLTDLNYIEDVELIDKEYREWVYLKKDPQNKHWLVNFIHKHWWGYGYDKYLITRNTVFIYLFFWIINLFIIKKMCLEVYNIELVSRDLKKEINENQLKRIWRRLTWTTFYTGIIFFGLYFKTENFVVNNNSLFGKKFLFVIYFFAIYGSGLVCIGYLASFILSK